MEKLDIAHHHLIVLLITLIVFITGITFGVKLSGATRGTDGMIITVFALCFLSIVLSFIIFTQLIHVKDSLAKLREERQPDKKTK